MRYICSALLVLVGTNLSTYSYTRYVTTRHVLVDARTAAEVFLTNHGFLPAVDTPAQKTAEAKDEAAKALIGDITLAGGLYYWWNRSLVYHGAAILLIAVGLLLPFVRSRSSAYTNRR